MSNASLVAALPRSFARRGAELRFTRIVLEPGEVCRIERGFRQVRVITGTAWISCRGLDRVLEAGETLTLPAKRRDRTLLSGLRGRSVVVELRERPRY